MAKTVGHVTSISVDADSAKFHLKLGEGPEKPIVLFSEEPKAAILPQVTLARRSWMLALLQSAMNNNFPVIADHDDNGTDSISVHKDFDLDLDFDFDSGGSAKPTPKPGDSPIRPVGPTKPAKPAKPRPA